jgi:NAD(P)-dependent dehydrogenase (short-subunit alcohol dehydrogenase family)
LPVLDAIFDLSGKTALVTGASSGIGARMARVLGSAGVRTAIVARRADRLDMMAKEFPDMLPISADLSDTDQVRRVARTALHAFGTIDILVNNAGMLFSGVTAELESIEQIRKVMAVNLEAPILLAQSVMPGMKKNGSGSIINVTSTVASAGSGRSMGAYAASKGGLQAIGRDWAAQWSRYGIRINSLSPGFTDTEINTTSRADEVAMRWVSQQTLLPRRGLPQDFDGAILFLASDASQYVTGQTLRVDGGWTVR